MADTTVEALIRDLLLWLSQGDRSYEEVMNAWRTSCPKLPVWEDACDRGLVAQDFADGRRMVSITPAGRRILNSDS
jgi:D-3-phosphoglycerate dehydrogenase